MLLYDHPLSSYAQKVKIALREKGVPFEAQLPESFGTGRQDDDFFTANPRSEVPVLIDGYVRIFDSTIILEYLEERWPQPPLLPKDPAKRAFARMTEDVCDTQYEAMNWGFGELLWFKRASGALEERLRAEAARQTKIMQDWLSGRLGDAPWFGGDTFGWADTAVAPMVNRSVHYGMGPRTGSPLAQWHARLKERPSVAQDFCGIRRGGRADGRRRRHLQDRRAAPRISRSPARMDGEVRRNRRRA